MSKHEHEALLFCHLKQKQSSTINFQYEARFMIKMTEKNVTCQFHYFCNYQFRPSGDRSPIVW